VREEGLKTDRKEKGEREGGNILTDFNAKPAEFEKEPKLNAARHVVGTAIWQKSPRGGEGPFSGSG